MWYGERDKNATHPVRMLLPLRLHATYTWNWRIVQLEKVSPDPTCGYLLG